jgi:serine/threonine protein kinase
MRTSPLSQPECQALLDRFELAWHSGVPDIRDFLSVQSLSLRFQLLLELIKIDSECRWRAGSEVPKLRSEEYWQVHVDLVDVAPLPLDIIVEEYRVRHLWGDRPAQAEYFERFPEQANQLGALLGQVAADLVCEYGSQPIGTVVPGSASPVRRLGKFELRSVLGHGAFGTVYEGWDGSLRQPVAIKIPHGDRLLSPTERERFLREARATAHWKHPGIVAVRSVEEDGHSIYIVADLVQGTSLGQWVKNHPLSPAETAALMAAVCDAVQFAHEHGVIHRDLKPSNILLEQGDDAGAGGLCPRVTDFGLAKQQAADVTVTMAGHLLGTPAYMSLEQFRNAHGVDGRADVYSLGVVLYELLTGRLPFAGTGNILAQQLEFEEPQPLRQLKSSIPRELEIITLKCLEKEPARRYQTSAELGDDLRRFLNKEPILARPISSLERIWRWCRVNRVAAFVLGVLILVATGSIMSAITIYQKEQAAQSSRLQAIKDRERADRNFEWARRISVDMMEKLIQHPHFRTAPEFRDLHETLLTFATSFFEDLVRQKSDDPLLEFDRGRAYWLLAVTRMFKNEKREALSDIGQMQAIFGRLAASFPEDSTYRFLSGWSFGLQASVLNDLGQPLEAEQACDKAIAILEELAGKSPDFARGIAKLAACYELRGILLASRRQTDEALVWMEKAHQRLSHLPATKDQDAISDQLFYLRKTREDKAKLAIQTKHWLAASSALSELLKQDIDNADSWYELAVAKLAEGDLDGCRRVCRDMMSRFQSTPKLDIAARTAYACVIIPNLASDNAVLLRLAEKAESAWNGNVRVLGAAAYRAGNYQRAVESFDKAAKLVPFRAWDYFFMSMACAKVKQLDRARRFSQEGNVWLKEAKRGKHSWGWTEQIESESLRREAESVLAENSK